jgi:hypothetical protein
LGRGFLQKPHRLAHSHLAVPPKSATTSNPRFELRFRRGEKIAVLPLEQGFRVLATVGVTTAGAPTSRSVAKDGGPQVPVTITDLADVVHVREERSADQRSIDVEVPAVPSGALYGLLHRLGDGWQASVRQQFAPRGDEGAALSAGFGSLLLSAQDRVDLIAAIAAEPRLGSWLLPNGVWLLRFLGSTIVSRALREGEIISLREQEGEEPLVEAVLVPADQAP